MASNVEISNLSLSYGSHPILKGIDLDVRGGEIVALLGRSGSGKSTLLRAIAGLEKPSEGEIRIGTDTLYSGARRIDASPDTRNLGLVFQSYALWPHMTVFDNVAFGLKIRGTEKDKIRARVRDILESVGLLALADRFPHQLSGGQQQRVALVRAIAYRPPVVLLDEPLSNLDAKLRDDARIWIRAVIKQHGLTAIFVTHDQTEAMGISDRLVLMNEGRIEQEGTPATVYEAPKTSFAARFMGSNIELQGKLTKVDVDGTCQVAVDQGFDVIGTRVSEDLAIGDSVVVTIRTREISLEAGGYENSLSADLTMQSYVGGEFEYCFAINGSEWRAYSNKEIVTGKHEICFKKDKCWVFSDEH